MKSTVFKATIFVMTVQTTFIVAKPAACKNKNNKETIICPAEVKTCPNGVDTVSRDTTDPTCAFFLCPIEECDDVDFTELNNIKNGEIGDKFDDCQTSLNKIDSEDLIADASDPRFVFQEILPLFDDFKVSNVLQIERKLKEIKPYVCDIDACTDALDSLSDAISGFDIPEYCELSRISSALTGLCDPDRNVCNPNEFGLVIEALKSIDANKDLADCEKKVPLIEPILDAITNFQIDDLTDLFSELENFQSAQSKKLLCGTDSCTRALGALKFALTGVTIPDCTNNKDQKPLAVFDLIQNFCPTDAVGSEGEVAEELSLP